MSQDVKEIASVIADFIEQQTTNDTRDKVLKELGKRFKALAPRYEFMVYEYPQNPEPGLVTSRTYEGTEKAKKSNETFAKELTQLSSKGWEIFDGMCTGPHKSTILRRQVG